MKWIQANSYAIQPTKENKLVIELPALKTKVQNPKLMYDKGENALLFRNETENYVLDYVHPQVREALYNATEVSICEYDPQKNEVLAFYDAPVQKVPTISVQLFQQKG